jgi:hypothetical protein
VITPIVVTWNAVNPDGSVATGAMRFTLTSGMEDSGTGEAVLPTPIVGQVHQGQLLANPVGGGGYEPLVLLANDDSTTVPAMVTYTVHEELVAGSLPDWQLTVHHAAAAGTMDLSTQRPTP